MNNNNNRLLICVDLEGAACMAEEDLGIHLEEWEGSEEKLDAPSISAVEDSLLFGSKYKWISDISNCSQFHIKIDEWHVLQ